MNPQIYAYALSTAFNLFIACFLVATLSLAAIYLFKLDRINEVFRHPLLRQMPFKRLPRSLQAAVLLDYFLRLLFPRARSGLFGNANRLLSHVDPAQVPMDVKWPILGLWGGCWIGLPAVAAVWILVLLQR